MKTKRNVSRTSTDPKEDLRTVSQVCVYRRVGKTEGPLVGNHEGGRETSLGPYESFPPPTE